jgi:hypothetical protein
LDFSDFGWLILKIYRNKGKKDNSMADSYWITGVWFNQKNHPRHITDVLTHFDGPTGFQVGQKRTEAEVIQLIRLGHKFTTIRWSYQESQWIRGAVVGIERVGNRDILRTNPDGTKVDNLDNMIDMIGIIP